MLQKGAIVVVLLAAFIFIGCDPLMGQKVDLLDKINEEIDYANAPWVPLNIDTGSMGTASLMGSQAQTVKKGYSFTLVFQPYADYPFQGWQARIEGDDEMCAWWKPGEDFINDPSDFTQEHSEKVKFVPQNADGTEAEIFIYFMPPNGKNLVIGPWGAQEAELNVTLLTGDLGTVYPPPGPLVGVKRGFPFTLGYQPLADYPFQGWQLAVDDMEPWRRDRKGLS